VSRFGYGDPETDLQLHLLGCRDRAAHSIMANETCSVVQKN